MPYPRTDSRLLFGRTAQRFFRRSPVAQRPGRQDQAPPLRTLQPQQRTLLIWRQTGSRGPRLRRCPRSLRSPPLRRRPLCDGIWSTFLVRADGGALAGKLPHSRVALRVCMSTLDCKVNGLCVVFDPQGRTLSACGCTMEMSRTTSRAAPHCSSPCQPPSPLLRLRGRPRLRSRGRRARRLPGAGRRPRRFRGRRRRRWKG